MRLKKSDALFLVKVLFHYECIAFSDSVKNRVKSIRSDLNDFLLTGDNVDADLTSAEVVADEAWHCSDAGKCSGCKSHKEEDDDDVQDEVKEEDGSEDQETEDESVEEEEEDDEDLFPDVDKVLDPEDLHALKKCEALGTEEVKEGDTLEFEACEGGTVDFLIDSGSTILVNVICLKREAKKFTIWTGDGESHTFEVSKFPKDWTKLLKVGVVYGTCEE